MGQFSMDDQLKMDFVSDAELMTEHNAVAADRIRHQVFDGLNLSRIPIIPTYDFNQLHIDNGYWYLATPFTKFPGGKDAAMKATLNILHQLTCHGIFVYSPIVHTYQLGMDYTMPTDHVFWQTINENMIRAAHGVCVAMLPSWENSAGVLHEMQYAIGLGRPLVYFRP